MFLQKKPAYTLGSLTIYDSLKQYRLFFSKVAADQPFILTQEFRFLFEPSNIAQSCFSTKLSHT